MKRNIMIILIFAAGLVCGLGVNQYFQGESPSSTTETTVETTAEVTPSSSSEMDKAEKLLDRVLPNSAPVWAYVDLASLRTQEKTYAALFAQPAIAKLFHEFSEIIPGATTALTNLYAHSDQLRIFLIAPDSGAAPGMRVS